ncbi:hypothetical protein B0H14DRAFT_3463264 [Mycena olivaceomarginata]|nr:hypothetical protein B0H14DRAFT_3463264 [Mycena olivaceomarginata]
MSAIRRWQQQRQQATAGTHGEAAPEGAGDEGDKAAAAATTRAHGEAAPEGAGDERDKTAAAATAGNEVGARGEAAPEGAAAVEHTRPKPKPAWRGVQSGGVMALERPEASGEENEGQGNGEGGWKDYDKSGWPQELINAFRAFERGKTWGGAEWASCVADFVALEQASDYPVKGDILTPQGEKNVRPEEIPMFMQRRRKWEKGVTLTSGIGPASAQGSFADRWWAWWMRAQPAARVKANGKLGPADAIPMEEWVKFSKMAGKNGLLLYMGGLLWWGEAAAAATDSKMLLGDWRVAVLNMACALRVAVAAKDNGLDLNAEAENEAVAEPTTRTKRKKPEGVKDEEDKENEWPKKADVLRAKGKARMSVVRAKIAEMHWKERNEHRARVAEDLERYRDRQDQKERKKREHKEAVKTRKQHVERNVLRQAHGLPPIPQNPPKPRAPHLDGAFRLPRRERSLRADRGMKGWKAFHRPQPAMPMPEPAASDGSDDNSSTHRAATPPIYEGGMTARTRAIAPMKCPECYCEGCPGCICMCPVSTHWIEHADGEGHFFPTCTECGRDECPGCSYICPQSTLLKDHGGHFKL